VPLTAPSVQTTGAPSIGLDGTVYVAAGDGFIYAVNPTPPGALLWKRQVASCPDYSNCTSPVVVTKDRLFFTTFVSPGAFGLFAMDHAGNPIAGWSKPANRKCLSIAKDGTVYAADGSRLQAFDPDTAAMKWSVDLGANPASCTLEGSGALVAIVGAELVAVDTATHAVRWHVNAYKGNTIVLGNDGSVFMLTDDKDVVALGY
jgi:outer membrane protein assembly factor BamB